MHALHCVTPSFLALTLISAAAPSLAQSYPYKNIRIITTSPAGSSDFHTRIIAQRISEPRGQNIIVDKRPSNIVGEMLANARPDGYTLLLTGGTIIVGPLLQKMNFDPVRDFATITPTTSEPNVL